MRESQEFMLLFRLQPSNQEPTPAQLEEMEKQWGEFIGTIAKQGKLVSTHQLGFEGILLSADQSISKGFHITEGQMIAGSMVLKSESIEIATELAKNCPILLMGGTVEVRNILPI